MSTSLPERTSRQDLTRFALFACLAGFITAFIFVGFPKLDIWLSSHFNFGDQKFVFSQWPLTRFLRKLLQLLFVLSVAFSLIAAIITHKKKITIWMLTTKDWLFILFCYAVGPGLVANLIFKNSWGRARPSQIIEFGGQQQFTPVLMHTDQCARNCSFVSGESSSIFMIFCALMLARPTYRKQIFIAGMLAGLFAGFLRVGAGGHFTSDVLYSGIFMLLTATGLYWLFFYSSLMKNRLNTPLSKEPDA